MANPAFTVDGKPFEYTEPKIDGKRIRALAGIPENVELYQKISGSPDKPIGPDTVVDLRPEGPEVFTTQVPDSEAG